MTVVTNNSRSVKPSLLGNEDFIFYCKFVTQKNCPDPKEGENIGGGEPFCGHVFAVALPVVLSKLAQKQ